MDVRLYSDLTSGRPLISPDSSRSTREASVAFRGGLVSEQFFRVDKWSVCRG
jgi:hypothetical protein